MKVKTSEKLYHADYINYLQEKTIEIGRIIIFAGIPAILYFILQDIFIIKIPGSIYYRLFFIIPFIIYISAYYTLFNKHKRLIIFFHSLLLIGLNISILTFIYYFLIHDSSDIGNIAGAINSYSVIVFIIFVLSGISKKYLLPIIVVPLITTLILVLIGNPNIEIGLLAHFSNPVLLILVLVIYSMYSEKKDYNEFALTKVTEEQLEQINIALEENKEISQKLLYELEFDHLTKAYNRNAGIKLIENDISEIKNSGGVLTAGYIDIDKLKYINDTYGHEAGDEYLKTIVAAVKEKTNKHYITRLGGDEFLIVFKDLKQEEAKILIEEIKEVLSKHAEKSKKSYNFSIGYYEVDKNSDKTLDQILEEADSNMYKEKSLKKITNNATY